MKQLLSWLVISICLICTINTAFAVRVTRLYQAQIPVASQTSEERNQVLQQGLTQVLIKVSGDNGVLNHPKIKLRLEELAGTLMQEFSYSPSNLPDNAKPYFLQLDFDADGINKVLRDAGVPIWGQNRPLILVWLDVEVPNHPAEIMTNDSANDISLLFKQNMNRRGLPIIFPMMDITDMNLVSVNDIVTKAVPILTNAAKRYSSDAMLMGHITQDKNGFNAQWTLVMGQSQWDWSMTGETIADVLTTVTNNIADTLAGRYAVIMTDTAQTKFTLQVAGVTEAEDFMQLMNYLQHLTPVADVQLIQVSGSDVTLNISLRGTRESFSQAVSLGKKLTSVNNNNQTIPLYQWNH